jgi:hypothetical protein
VARVRLRRPRLRRWLALAALLPLLLLTCGSGANGAGVVPFPWPGVPLQIVPDGYDPDIAVGSWSTGINEVARARQWMRIPAQAIAAASMNGTHVIYPANDPQHRNSSKPYLVRVYLSSPSDAEYGYGIGIPATVRTVAFGAVPVEAVLRLEQLRDADDLPVALQLRSTSDVYNQFDPDDPRSGATVNTVNITGKVRVRLTALSVDGVDVGLRECVSAPIELDLQGNPSYSSDPDTDPHGQPFAVGSTEWNAWLAARGIGLLNGGGVSGDVDIPAFSHCLTKSGEDMSPLLTGTISGPGNAVTIGYAAISGAPVGTDCGSPLPGGFYHGARAPFRGDPSDCPTDYAPPTFDYPARSH